MRGKAPERCLFIDITGKKLYVGPVRKSVEFLTNTEETKKCDTFTFSDEELQSLISYLISLGQRVDPDFTPRDCFSTGSDYYEYYDRTHDNNGYLSVTTGKTIIFDRPHGSIERLYLMTMSKLKSLVYDLKVIGTK